MTEDQIVALQKKYAGLWHIADPYEKAIDTVKSLRMSLVLKDEGFSKGYIEGLHQAEDALKELRDLELARRQGL